MEFHGEPPSDDVIVARVFRECLLTRWPTYDRSTIVVTRGEEHNGRLVYYMFSKRQARGSFYEDVSAVVRCAESKLGLELNSVRISAVE